ncbi:septal ring lytic transglycosylase RlpA family protein [Caldimonas tepidiphila]|uniref:septal ring lytic transglycosylase RlpA family protein n=1 Tax=Caldimonas tepidiphila TaxID=2315841 RepID=UPI001300599C|nr:septal ring lytic transglycosylase RlpA family protein [Caldimonas tepidiphila]
MSEAPLDLDEPPATLARGDHGMGSVALPAASHAAPIPGAVPRVESPTPGANNPYTVLGRSYVPLTGDPEFRQRGVASWYGNKFQGRRTSSGEPYDMYKMTAAHPTMPIPSYARVRHVASGREVIVRINDRGPFHSDRVIDLSYSAAQQLGLLGGGSAIVEIERLTNESIRAGAWRRDDPAVATSFPVPASPPPDYQPVVPVAAQPARTTASAQAPSPGYWLQFGAFQQRDGAERFQRQLAGQSGTLATRLKLFNDGKLFKLQAGPYRTHQEAAVAARQARDGLHLTPMVVRQR